MVALLTLACSWHAPNHSPPKSNPAYLIPTCHVTFSRASCSCSRLGSLKLAWLGLGGAHNECRNLAQRHTLLELCAGTASATRLGCSTLAS